MSQTRPETANTSWLYLLHDIRANGRPAKPRGQRVLELLGYQSQIDMKHPVVSVAKRIEGKFHGFMCAEAAWILSGDNRLRSIAPYSKMIEKFSDDGRYFRGAYGPKIVDQLTYVVDALVEDSDTRQAVMNIWRENPRPTKDVPCTLSAQWMIRDGVLHCFDTMRSSDAWLGWPFDVFNFSMLSYAIALLIRDRGIDPPAIGTLRLTAASQHVYERNFARVDDCLADHRRGFETHPLDPFEFKSLDDLIDYLWETAEIQVGKTGALFDDREFLKELR